MPMRIEEAREYWRAVVCLGEAVVALRGAREGVLLASGSAVAAASLDVLEKSAQGLLNETGALLAAQREADDPEVAGFVRLLLDRLAAAPPVEASTAQPGC